MDEQQTYKKDCTAKQRLICSNGVRLKRVNAHFFFLQNLHLIMPVCCSDINNDASISCYTCPLMTKMGKHKSVTVNNSQIP